MDVHMHHHHPCTCSSHNALHIAFQNVTKQNNYDFNHIARDCPPVPCHTSSYSSLYACECISISMQYVYVCI